MSGLGPDRVDDALAIVAAFGLVGLLGTVLLAALVIMVPVLGAELWRRRASGPGAPPAGPPRAVPLIAGRTVERTWRDSDGAWWAMVDGVPLRVGTEPGDGSLTNK
jgi:uncharacterized iron-regulated membrane protein